MVLSAMSPIWLAIETAMETPMSPAPACVVPAKISPITAAPIHPAMAPDHVFLGLTRGQSLGPPKMRPAK